MASLCFYINIACCQHALIICLQQTIKYMVITPDLPVTIDLMLVELILAVHHLTLRTKYLEFFTYKYNCDKHNLVFQDATS